MEVKGKDSSFKNFHPRLKITPTSSAIERGQG
jgi:hypothetical protein